MFLRVHVSLLLLGIDSLPAVYFCTIRFHADSASEQIMT